MQLRLRVLRRMAPSRLHLSVLFHVGIVCVVERAGADFAARLVAVALLAVLRRLYGGAREVVEKVERLAKGFLGGTTKGA